MTIKIRYFFWTTPTGRVSYQIYRLPDIGYQQKSEIVIELLWPLVKTTNKLVFLAEVHNNSMKIVDSLVIAYFLERPSMSWIMNSIKPNRVQHILRHLLCNYAKIMQI